MLKHFSKKIVPLALTALLLASAALAPFDGSFAAKPATPAKPAKPVNLSCTGVPHNATGAADLIETLLSEDSKRIRDRHNAKNPNAPFIKNVRISASPGSDRYAIGKFSGGLAKSNTSGETVLNFNDGIVLTTGDTMAVARSYNGGDRYSFMHYNGSARNDADLAALIGRPADTMMDTTYIEFDVFSTPETDKIMFEYALGSDEYNEFLTYNDVFGIFINGKNISTIPNTNQAISISNINHLTNKQFFRNNKLDKDVRGDNYGTNDLFLDLPSEYDGFTSTFTAAGALKPNQYNRVKIAIADNKDQKLDSALFLKTGTLQFRDPKYGTIDLESWSDDNQIEIVRSEGTDNSVSVDLRVKDINGNLIQLKDEKGIERDYFTVSFNNGESKRTVTLPPISDDALINGSLPVYISISNPQNGAILGQKTEIRKGYQTATAQFGQWLDSSPKTADTIEITRTGSTNFKATLELVKTDKSNRDTTEAVTFEKGKSSVTVTVPEDTRFVELTKPRGIQLGTPSKLEKFFPGIPTGLKKFSFNVAEDSEVALELLSVNLDNPKFNYKITKRPSLTKPSFTFYGDGKNLVNGMKDIYYMEEGTYDVEIYWLDKHQAETLQELLQGKSKTRFDAIITPIGDKLDKKKFYKKLN